MNIPESIRIGDQVFQVKLVTECNSDGRVLAGNIDFVTGVLKLRSDMFGDYLDCVFLHEVMHGMFEFMGYEQDETMVDRLAKALHMVIKDNPSIFEKESGGSNENKN